MSLLLDDGCFADGAVAEDHDFVDDVLLDAHVGSLSCCHGEYDSSLAPTAIWRRKSCLLPSFPEALGVVSPPAYSR